MREDDIKLVFWFCFFEAFPCWGVLQLLKKNPIYKVLLTRIKLGQNKDRIKQNKTE